MNGVAHPPAATAPEDEATPSESLHRFKFGEETWRLLARCRDMDTAIFFPYRGASQKAALAVCALCPVRTQCGDYADRSNSTYGIWGGNIRHRGPEAKEVDGSLLHECV